MELETTENPWKNKSRVKFIAVLDLMVAFTAIIYSTFYMFHYYFKDEREKIAVNINHLPILIFIWTANLLFYAWQIAVAVVLYSSVNLEAVESDPYIAIQKCNCWLRTARVIMAIVVLKLCCIPVILLANLNFLYDYSIIVGTTEIVFRFLAIWGVKSFIQDLQT